MKDAKLWRKTRESPKSIPQELWDAAAKLSETYSINQISKALCLNHTSLKERVHKIKDISIQEVHPPSFVELNFEHSPLVSDYLPHQSEDNKNYY